MSSKVEVDSYLRIWERDLAKEMEYRAEYTAHVRGLQRTAQSAAAELARCKAAIRLGS